MKRDEFILEGPNRNEYTVRVIFGEAAARAYIDGDIDELVHQHALYVKRSFSTFEEAKAYKQGILDMDGEFMCAMLPAIEAEPIYLQNNSNCKWIERVAFPEYATVFLFGATSFDEYLDYYGENGKEDVENYQAWYNKYIAQLHLQNNQMVSFVLVEENAERPSTFFEPYPIFGKACDVVLIDVYLITTGNGTEATH